MPLTVTVAACGFTLTTRPSPLPRILPRVFSSSVQKSLLELVLKETPLELSELSLSEELLDEEESDDEEESELESPSLRELLLIDTEVVDSLDLGSIIHPKRITAEYILRYVRAMQNSYGSEMESLYELIEGKVEALEFKVRHAKEVTDMPLSQIRLKRMS